MRSPWRFLADLTARPKPKQPLLPAPVPESPTDEANDGRASVSAAGSLDQTDTAEITQLDEADQAAPPELVAVVDDRAPTADARVSNPHPDPLELAMDKPATDATSTRSDEAIVSKAGKKRAKRIEQGHVERPSSSVLRPDDVSEQPATSARPAFLDEVLTLDVEIADLKVALAQRLKQQNAQLRRMLERFENR
ncbi:hypothetical protein [Rhizobium multihospitium]|uniref:Uncharacterized protein n=1 Tax=Rhizobium multihospitium TaxID=410764 RepID=A0A1C3X483_9HYPH|nr:hypothetical protein [Rhizobium multihospitium]SCB46985.1 hypothetical protein GA0061103_0055 [Rhizobium multihospitium]